ncbi:MAG: hypothetical protein ABSE99_00220 [Terracidiphilus sp.]|jgi:hypothetical protein
MSGDDAVARQVQWLAQAPMAEEQRIANAITAFYSSGKQLGLAPAVNGCLHPQGAAGDID